MLLGGLDSGTETGEEACRLGRCGRIPIGGVEGNRGGKGGICRFRGGREGFLESDVEVEHVVDPVLSTDTGLSFGDASSLKSMRDDLRPRAAGEEGLDEAKSGCMGGMEQRASAVGDVESKSRKCCC